MILGVHVLTPGLSFSNLSWGGSKIRRRRLSVESKGLVNCYIIKGKIIKRVCSNTWELARHGYERWYDIANGRTREEARNAANGYVDS